VTDPWLALVLGLVTGLILGAAHFGALWWTVRRLPRRRRPGLWLTLSAIGRFAAVLAGFVALAKAHPLALLAALIGFLLARLAATRRVGGVPPSGPQHEPEGGPS
jgi:F1F0 ATPase subunit 2